MSEAITETLRVLVVDDDLNHAEALGEVLERVGHECTLASGGKAGMRLIEKEEFDLVITDLRMSDIDGLGVLRKAKQSQPQTEVILITGYADVKTAVQAIQQGALHYLMKPLDMGELRAIVSRVAERVQLQRANRDLRAQLDERFGFDGVIGNSPGMAKVLAKLKAFAPTAMTMLILGENGTGKELVAKAIHTNSPRKNKPFVAMNCAALNENLLDDEMFGHEPGSFTGADKLRKGRFEYAHGGTLFLDEIGDMPLALQAKLLRVLENHEIVRIGSNEPIKVDVRVVAATNRNLEEMIAAKEFRQDLYHRLKHGSIRLPALRERKEDIPLLTAHFLKEANTRHGKAVTSLAEPVRRAFHNANWPGNVRQLRNVIESAVVQDSDNVINLDDLPEEEGLLVPSAVQSSSGSDALIGRPLSEVERYYIEKALELTKGNREEAAKMLGIGERTLYRVIQDWKLQDKLREAIAAANGDLDAAAASLDMKRDALERKLKKLGQRDEA